MEQEIEQLLERESFSSQKSLKEFVSQVQGLLFEYEQKECGEDEKGMAKIREWRRQLFGIIRKNREIPEMAEEGVEDAVNTLHLVNKQKNKAEENQNLLEKGTLKLLGLHHTTGEIEKEIATAKRKIVEGKSKEREERRNLFLSFFILITVSLALFIDKLRTLFVS